MRCGTQNGVFFIYWKYHLFKLIVNRDLLKKNDLNNSSCTLLIPQYSRFLNQIDVSVFFQFENVFSSLEFLKKCL